MIIGMGSGRCGTMSLARLLDKQDGLTVSHERYGSEVTWGACGEHMQRMVRGRLSDVAFYWLPCAEKFLRAGARVICLRRDRQETIESYVRKTFGRNPWGPGDEGWRSCYPAYQYESKRKSIGAYYDMYYRWAEELEAHKNFHLLPIEVLNSEAGQEEILDAAGVMQKRIRVGIKCNEGT